MKHLLITLLLFLGTTMISFGQNSGEKAAFDPNNAGQNEMTSASLSVIDQLIAVEQDVPRNGLSVDWTTVYHLVTCDLPSDISADDARACVLMGFKITDATLALKAEDADGLMQCIASIEKLASELNIPIEAMGRATRIKSASEQNDWMDTFLQLTMMHRDISRQLESLHKSDHSRGVLIICGTWIQMSRVTYAVIAETKSSPSLLNHLRSPIKLMRVEIANITDPEMAKSEQVKELGEILPEIQSIVDKDYNSDTLAEQSDMEKISRLPDLVDKFVMHQLEAISAFVKRPLKSGIVSPSELPSEIPGSVSKPGN